MLRTSLLATASLLLVAAAAPAQSPGYSPPQDPYKVYVVPGYWGRGPGSALHGAADLVRAQGQFLIDYEHSNLLHEKLRQEKLVTRRQELEQWAWEHNFKTRVFEEWKEQSHDIELRRVVRDARPVEVASGAALNSLLHELTTTKVYDTLSAGSSTELSPECLAHVHVNCDNGNSGLLKGDKIAWPLLILGRADLADERAEIENLLNQAKVAVLRGNRAGAAVQLVALRRSIDQMEARLRSEVRSGYAEDWRPGQYVAAIRSLNELKDSMVILERPDAAAYLNPIQGKTAFDVVQYMKSNGFTFAPATWGDERYYKVLYDALRDDLVRAGGVPERQNP